MKGFSLAAAMLFGLPTMCLACPAPTAAPVEAAGVSYYVDGEKSVPDPELLRSHSQVSAPVRGFLATITRAADASLKGDVDQASCARDHLTAWATGRALERLPSDRAGFTQLTFDLGGIALAYAKIREQVPDDQRGVVEPWLRRMLDVVRSAPRGKRNNIDDWRAFSHAAVGLAVRDDGLVRQGLASLAVGAGAIGPDGSIAAETARGSKAGAYHNFALAPLAATLSIAANRGIPVAPDVISSIHRLSLKVARDETEPSPRQWGRAFLGEPGPYANMPRLGGDPVMTAAWLSRR